MCIQEKIEKSSAFIFYAYGNNFIEIINMQIPEQCIVNHGTTYASDSIYQIADENITAVEAIQVSDYFFDLFPMAIESGRNFQTCDINGSSSEAIPVIMGSEYRKSFEIGDQFEAYYICERRMFTVIGFTDAESKFYLRSENRNLPYKNYIIMPFQNVTEDSFASRAVLLQQICGYIAPCDTREAAEKVIQEYLNDSGLTGWANAISVNERSLREKLFQ